MNDFITKNQYGITFPLCSYTQAFIDFASTCNGISLDIGACYGATVIPVLQAGGKVVANDIESSHLDVLMQNTPPDLRKNLKTHCGSFPHDFKEFEEGSIHAILASHILHFLDLPDLYKGLELIHKLLHDDGKVFALSFSPFTNRTRDFIAIYRKRKELGDQFPGFIRDCNLLNMNRDDLPQINPLIHYMDLDTFERIFREAGFKIEKSSYVAVPEDDEIHPLYHYDGREWVGIIASKDK